MSAGTSPPGDHKVQSALKTEPRRFPLDAVLVLLSMAALSMAAVTPGTRSWTLGFLLILLVAAAMTGAGQALNVALFSCLAVAAPLAFSMARNWPWTLLLPLAVYGAAVLSLPSLRRNMVWFRPGSLGKGVWRWMLAFIVMSAAALVGWYVWLKPDLSVQFAQMPAMPAWLLPLAGLGFALLNAAMEEVVFRGVLMGGLDGTLGRSVLSLVLQALVFGCFHYLKGFPNGVWGVLMTFAYGLMLGWLKNRSKGLLAPVITHTFADLTIFAILAAILQQ